MSRKRRDNTTADQIKVGDVIVPCDMNGGMRAVVTAVTPSSVSGIDGGVLTVDCEWRDEPSIGVTSSITFWPNDVLRLAGQKASA